MFNKFGLKNKMQNYQRQIALLFFALVAFLVYFDNTLALIMVIKSIYKIMLLHKIVF